MSLSEERKQAIASAIEKEAGIFSAAKAGGKNFYNALKKIVTSDQFKTYLAGGIALAGVGATIEGGRVAGQALSSPIKKELFYRNMIKYSPQLREENKGSTKRIFNTLYKFNPEMASDPLVAASFLRRSLQFKEEGIQPVDVKTLVDAYKSTWLVGNHDRLFGSGGVGDMLRTIPLGSTVPTGNLPGLKTP